MKRIVLLIDGTWDQEGISGNTNVAKLDGTKIANAIIRGRAAGDVEQLVHYHPGVGTSGSLLERLLGGALGLGLKEIIKEVYEFLVSNYESGDEIYIFGFSRGSYAARALAGLIGASGIQRRVDDAIFEIAWSHYRTNPAARLQAATKSVADYNSAASQQAFHVSRSIQCIAVWDTVGSYGIPAGFGLTALARYYALITLGFHDTSFGQHIAVGLHALGIDEHRRPFVPTFWTIPVGQKPTGHVEQTWFAGAHCNVGGGYPDSGLSDLALIWMIARMQALTSLQFDAQSVLASTKPNVGGLVVDSTKGWLIDHYFPHYRKILSPVAIHHGYFMNTEDRSQVHINERVHWSAIAKREGRNPVGVGSTGAPYVPPNLPSGIQPDKIAALTDEELALLGGHK